MSATFLKSSCQDFNPTEWIMLFSYSVLYWQIRLVSPFPYHKLQLTNNNRTSDWISCSELSLYLRWKANDGDEKYRDHSIAKERNCNRTLSVTWEMIYSIATISNIKIISFLFKFKSQYAASCLLTQFLVNPSGRQIWQYFVLSQISLVLSPSSGNVQKYKINGQWHHRSGPNDLPELSGYQDRLCDAGTWGPICTSAIHHHLPTHSGADRPCWGDVL